MHLSYLKQKITYRMLFRIRVVEKYRKQNYSLLTQFIILMLQMVLTWSTGYTVGTM